MITTKKELKRAFFEYLIGERNFIGDIKFNSKAHVLASQFFVLENDSCSHCGHSTPCERHAKERISYVIIMDNDILLRRDSEEKKIILEKIFQLLQS